MVDALVSGINGCKAVQVRVLSWAEPDDPVPFPQGDGAVFFRIAFRPGNDEALQACGFRNCMMHSCTWGLRCGLLRTSVSSALARKLFGNILKPFLPAVLYWAKWIQKIIHSIRNVFPFSPHVEWTAPYARHIRVWGFHAVAAVSEAAARHVLAARSKPV